MCVYYMCVYCVWVCMNVICECAHVLFMSIICMCVHMCMCVCVCVSVCAGTCLWMPTEARGFPWSWKHRLFMRSLTWVPRLSLNSSPLGDQCMVLTAEPLLQPKRLLFACLTSTLCWQVHLPQQRLASPSVTGAFLPHWHQEPASPAFHGSIDWRPAAQESSRPSRSGWDCWDILFQDWEDSKSQPLQCEGSYCWTTLAIKSKPINKFSNYTHSIRAESLEKRLSTCGWCPHRGCLSKPMLYIRCFHYGS